MGAATTQGLTLFLSSDTGQSADAIVVLSYGDLANKERVEAAVQLWQAKRATIILVTGMTEVASRYSAQITHLGILLQAQFIEPQSSHNSRK
ncbi:MAG: hypothetical protein AAGI69_09550 [Cyanobacteria bacterium P01_H01_bin.21]